MKRHGTVIIAFIILLLSVATLCWTHRRAKTVAKGYRNLSKEVQVAQARAATVVATRAGFAEASKSLDQIDAHVTWESDPTFILRWFANTADAVGVYIEQAQIVTLSSGLEQVGNGDVVRTQYEIRARGTFQSLVHYLDRIEKSPHVMVVEKLTMSATRSRDAEDGEGELHLTVSNLYPATKDETSKPVATVGKSQEGGAR